jgi:hypothetical protein
MFRRGLVICGAEWVFGLRKTPFQFQMKLKDLLADVGPENKVNWYLMIRAKKVHVGDPANSGADHDFRLIVHVEKANVKRRVCQ